MSLERYLSSISTCYNCRCGFCKEKCPLFHQYRIESVSPRGKVFMALALSENKLKQSNSLADRMYSCSLCAACKTICPPQVDIPGIIEAIRSNLVEEGFVPKTHRDVLNNTNRNGNPWGEPKEKRSKWGEGLNVKHLTQDEKTDILYFVGCTPSYETRNQKLARSIVKVFNEAIIDYGILGNEEKCCGGPVLRIGEKGLFEMLAEQNLENFKRYSVDMVVTTSPHCYNTFKNDYPDLNSDFQVQHYVQFIANLIDQNKIRFSKKLDKRVTYHDPCFLGHINDVYEAPRKILESIPGLTLIEMERTKDNSFCCGGGGGRIWMEETSEDRPSLNRARESASIQPDIVATACPFCLINLEDAIKVIGKEEEIQVRDIIELVGEAI